MKRAPERGAAAIEFALVLIMLVTLLMGGLDFSRLFAASVSVADAAQAGVLYGIRDDAKAADLKGIEQAAADDAAGAHLAEFQATARQKCTCSDGNEIVCGSDRCGSKRQYVEVTAKAPFHTMGVYPFLPNPMMLSSTVSMRSR